MPRQLADVVATFVTGVARDRDQIYVALDDAELSRDDVPHSIYASLWQQRWYGAGQTSLPWRCAGLAFAHRPADRMIAISEDGDVHTYASSVVGQEQILPAPACLRGVTSVDGSAIAYGMRRQVWIRDGESRWRAMHAPELRDGETGGFEAMCGFALDDLYAVGWEGEIWHHDGKAWRRERSPVDVILTGATTNDDMVYACGQNGTIVRGRAGKWTVVAASATVEDLWSIAALDGAVYVASLGSLYRLAGDALRPVDEALKLATSFGKLTAADGLLWSIGAEDLLWFDGTRWAAVPLEDAKAAKQAPKRAAAKASAKKPAKKPAAKKP